MRLCSKAWGRGKLRNVRSWLLSWVRSLELVPGFEWLTMIFVEVWIRSWYLVHVATQFIYIPSTFPKLYNGILSKALPVPIAQSFQITNNLSTRRPKPRTISQPLFIVKELTNLLCKYLAACQSIFAFWTRLKFLDSASNFLRTKAVLAKTNFVFFDVCLLMFLERFFPASNQI